MPGFDWYRLFNHAEFLALDVPSREFDVVLGTLGQKTILATRGNLTSILYDGIFLSIDLNGRHPFRFGEFAVWLDVNDDVWLGVYHAD